MSGKAIAAAALLATACIAAATHAVAQQYPVRAIRMIVGYPPGGGTDLLARPVAQKLGQKWSQSVVVDNRSGANGMIAGELVAKSAPDGYTLLMATSAELALNLAVYSKVPYDPEREFAPVSLLATSPLVLAVHPSLPAKNVKEFIALAKKQPGTIGYASGGAGGPHHIAGEWMKMLAKIDIIHVPYRGGGPLLVDLMGGHVVSGVIALPVVAPHVKSGKLRAIAVTSIKRSSAIPDVPTLDESGLKGLDVSQWWALLAPGGTPREIVAKLHDEVVDIIRLPDVKARMAELGMEPVGSTPGELGALIRTDIAKYTKIAKQANIKID